MAEDAAQPIVVQILADIRGLLSGMKEASGAVEGATLQMKGAMEGLEVATKAALGPFLAILAVVQGFGVLKEAVTHTVEMAEGLEKLSMKTGATVEELSRLQYAAHLSDVSVDQLTTGFIRLSRAMGEAQKGGTSPAAAAFKMLGVSATDASGQMRPMREVLIDLADRFHEMPNGATKTALALQLFSRSGANLIPFLNQGRDGIQKLEAEADRLGVTMNEKDVAAALKYEEAMKRLHEVMGAFVRDLVVGCLPALELLAQSLTFLVKTIQGALLGMKALGQFLAAGFRGDTTEAVKTALAAQAALKAALKAFDEHPVADHMGNPDGKTPTFAGTDLGLMEKLSLELDRLRNKDANGQKLSAAQEAAFWDSKLKLAEVGSKDYIAIYAKYTEAHQQALDEQEQIDVAHIKANAALLKDDLAAQVQFTKDELAIIRKRFGDQSKEVAEGMARVNEAIARLQEHDTKEWEHIFEGISGAWSHTIDDMKQSGGTFREFMRGLLQNLVADFAMAEMKIAVAHAAAWLARKGITAQGLLEEVALHAWSAIKIIAMEAAKAAAAAWAAIAGIPFVGPFLAPAVAGAALAGVMALAGNIASASGGYDIPSGINPLTQLHSQEMVLPAHLANAVRDMAAGGGGGGGGGTHLHVHAMDSSDVARFIMKHKGAVAAAAHAAAKGGQGFRSQPGRRA